MMHPRKGEFFSSRVRYISLNQIRPNPQQPRRSFDEESLSELAESIRSYGILQPLTVRRQGTGYELVAGERRLRAATMAGLREVPCLVAQVGEEDSALLALMENLQRRDLDCWEEAEALSRLIARYGLSQEETARRLGRSQPAGGQQAAAAAAAGLRAAVFAGKRLDGAPCTGAAAAGDGGAAASGGAGILPAQDECGRPPRPT